MTRSLKGWSADSVIFGGLLLLLAWMPLPWGSHRPWAGPLIGAAAFALIGLWLLFAGFGLARLPSSRRLWWPLAAWMVWLGWVAFQVWPQSAAALGTIAPRAADLHAAAAQVGAVEPLETLSIAPGTTVDSLLLSLAYFGLYWLVVLTACDNEARMRWVLGVVVLAGLGEAVYGSLMVLSGIEWSFFEPKHYYRGFATGTFVNRNHLAGYLELAAAAGIGLILADLQHSRGKRPFKRRIRELVDTLFSNKMRVRLSLAIVVVALVLTRSRMGNTALFGSMTACGFVFVLLRERGLAGRAAILFLSLLLVDLLIVGKWFGLDAVVERIQQTEVSHNDRVQILELIPAVVEQYAPAGSGLGTFAVAFEPFRTEALNGYYDHAHNDYAEFAVETGFTGLGLILLLAGIHYLHALRVMMRRTRRTPAGICFATWMGLTAFGIHSLTDFNLQIPANAGTLVVFLALAACCSSRSQRKIMTTASTDKRADSSAPPVDTLS